MSPIVAPARRGRQGCKPPCTLSSPHDEVLTFALGFLLAHDHSFCTELVQHLRIAPRQTLSSVYSVHLQEVTGSGFGRRDIVIEDDRTRIVLEAKIGDAEERVP